MSGLGPEASALLEAARNGDEPTQVDAGRVRAAIATRLAAGLGAGAAGLGAAAAARSWAMPLVRSGAMLPVAMALVVAIDLSPRFAAQHGAGPATDASQNVAPAPVAAPAESASRPSVAASPPAPATSSLEALTTPAQPGAREHSAPVAVSTSASSPRSVSATRDVAAEVRLLVEAHRAIDNGDATRALVLLAEHARRYPKGALGEERDAARVRALCALGRSAEAREATERFLRTSPQSPLAGPLRASCGGTASLDSSGPPPF
jgi:hypothetical protein